MVDQAQSVLPDMVQGAVSERRQYLFGPVTDFITLGGGSVFVLAAVALLMPATVEAKAALAGVMLYIAHLINNPHFAHSYQIFYSGFSEKAFGTATPKLLRIRYIVAGIFVPAALILFFALAAARQDAALLGLAGNLMLLTVGWHYAKQGYGMLMVDSVLKRRFFDDFDKKILLFNTHACWIVFWVTLNTGLSKQELFGFTYYTLTVPNPILWVGYVVVTFSSLAVTAIFWRKWRSAGTLPFNGVIAYTVTIYVWLFVGLRDPILLFVVPAFHSLQYLAVVWRFQINQTHDLLDTAPERMSGPITCHLPPNIATHVIIFAVSGVVLGFVGFWGAPFVLAQMVPVGSSFSSGALFLFIFWVFINIHHYFLDNVMWRRENPTTRKYLFS